VKIFKWIRGSEIHKLYAVSDVFVLPSRSEGQPLTLLEAMASQLYIVTTPVGGIPETLHGYEYKTYLRYCSPAEILTGVLKALKVVSKGEKIDSKSISYAERFDWSYVTTQIEEVYSYVLKRFGLRQPLTCRANAGSF
jgi:glycosyltransferase involved in cell wall biosynthesis